MLLYTPGHKVQALQAFSVVNAGGRRQVMTEIAQCLVCNFTVSFFSVQEPSAIRLVSQLIAVLI